MSKKSIRFFNDREVRALWGDDHNKWWFSATDIVRAINDEDDYKKCRNYWKFLKGKMAKDGVEVVSALTTSNSKLQMASYVLRMRLMQNVCRRLPRIIPITEHVSSLTGSRIATQRLMVRV